MGRRNWRGDDKTPLAPSLTHTSQNSTSRDMFSPEHLILFETGYLKLVSTHKSLKLLDQATFYGLFDNSFAGKETLIKNKHQYCENKQLILPGW